LRYADAKAKLVVMFVNEDNCRQLINATIVNELTDLFYWLASDAIFRQLGVTIHTVLQSGDTLYWLASDSWGAKRVPVDKQEWAAEGTVTILPTRQVVHSTSHSFHMKPPLGEKLEHDAD